MREPDGEGSRVGEELPPMGKVFDFLRLIWAVDQGINALSKRMERVMGITAIERLALRIVGRLPGLPAGMLAEFLRLHPATLTGMLQRLEQRGVLQRRLDPRDGRRVLLGLTAQGRALDVPVPGTVESSVERALSGLPALKLAAARDVLETLVRALEEDTRRGEERSPRQAQEPAAGEPLRQHGRPPPALEREARQAEARPGDARPAKPAAAPRRTSRRRRSAGSTGPPR